MKFWRITIEPIKETISLSSQSLKELANLIQENTSPLSGASQVVFSLVPMLGVLFGTFLFFSLFYFYHKQKMLMIEKGFYKPLRLNWNLIFFVSGLIIGFSGLVITIVFVLNGISGIELLGGGIPLAVGLAIFLSYFFSKKVSGGR